MTSSDLQLRLPIRRVRAGQYETLDGRIGIVQVGLMSWIVLVDGRLIELDGVRENSSLTEAHGRLADTRERLLERSHR